MRTRVSNNNSKQLLKYEHDDNDGDDGDHDDLNGGGGGPDGDDGDDDDLNGGPGGGGPARDAPRAVERAASRAPTVAESEQKQI